MRSARENCHYLKIGKRKDVAVFVSLYLRGYILGVRSASESCHYQKRGKSEDVAVFVTPYLNESIYFASEFCA